MKKKGMTHAILFTRGIVKGRDEKRETNKHEPSKALGKEGGCWVRTYRISEFHVSIVTCWVFHDDREAKSSAGIGKVEALRKVESHG